jgi:hypothetical protein
MKNLKNITNDIKFKDIFDLYGTNFSTIIKTPNLPEDFIDEYFFQLKPFKLEKWQKLTPYLIVKYQNNLNWQLMSEYQNIPLSLIIKYQEILNWDKISKYQNLPEFGLNFINHFQDKLNFSLIKNNVYMTPEFLSKIYSMVST